MIPTDPRIDCNTKLPFICEKYNTSLLERHDPDYKPPKKSCPDGWQVFQNKVNNHESLRQLRSCVSKPY